MRIPRWSAVLVATAVGAGVGAAVAAAGSVDYKAEAKVVVQAKGGPGVVHPQLPNVRELATSSLLAGNVDSTLRLQGSPEELRKRLHAFVAPGSQVIVLALTDSHGDRARQIAQESAVVLTQLVPTRFRTPPLTASVLDPAHVVSKTERHFARDASIGAAAALVVALTVVFALRRGSADVALASRERQLDERIDLVGKRELELAKRAGEIARRERSVDAREAEVAASEEAREREAAAVKAEAPPPVEVPLPPPPPAEEARVPELVDVDRGPGPSRLPTLDELERLVEERRAAFPGRAAEWSDYLFYLRAYADPTGRIPEHFAGLVQDVFGEILL